MKILVVSDTHGKDENLEKVLEMEKPLDALVHCGDIEGREDYIAAVAECPVYLVAGNNDFFSDLDREMVTELGGRKVLITHGHFYRVSLDFGLLVDEALDRAVDVVLFGHIHKPVCQTERGVLLINPGSLSYPRQEGRKPSYAVIQAESGGRFACEIRYLKRRKN
ncbi:MAG TPA: metallophosphoesterase [Candidatus Blautia gallistercoris]|uniref:Phosphoesterase n=1 Tax=Candidatus Blautia gallistercoris TaxID=2838490 RepID=A0A9D1WG03_9FIRM|nr:metallophosphoesterase [Candidatus Blautia gallistercoris]